MTYERITIRLGSLTAALFLASAANAQSSRAVGEAENRTGTTEICNQESEFARSECLRRDITDDDLPAGMTRGMRQRQQQAEQARDTESMNVASEADTGSDQAGGRSRTRSASRDLPGPEDQADRSSQSQDTDTQAPDSDADNAADTLGRE